MSNAELKNRLNVLAEKLIEGHSSQAEDREFQKLYSLLRE
ncbi:hypothetical protein ND16A_2160 [Thalassotalea sp. ND16A]|nr:hypothetical protein ND16A_2160 [Thalassotalea sp. ND16A]